MDPFFIYLSESYKALDEIQPLTTNQILFEAEDNEKVAKISSKNEASKEKSDNMFMKALAKLRALIDKVIDSIKNFIDYMGLSKDQKALYKDFREKVKNNPEFRNKKVTVKVYEGIQEAYGNALKNAEATYKNIKDEESGARNEEIAKTLDKAKENVNYVEKSVTLAALCKMIDQNEALARNIESAILIDRMTLNKLEQTYGKKGAKKIEDHIYVKTHKIGILKLGARGIIMKARQKEVEYVGDTLKELTKDIPSLLSAANAIDKDKTKAITRIAMRTAMDVGGDSVAQGAGGPIKRFAKKQVTQKGPVGFVRRKYHEKFDRKENIADDIEGAKSYLRLRRESSDDLDLYDDLFDEGANMEYRSQLAALKVEYKASMKAIKKYRSVKDYNNALREISNLQNSLSKYETIIRNTYDTVESTIIGNFMAYSITFVKCFITYVLTTMATAGAGSKINNEIYNKSDNLVLNANGAVLNKRMVTANDADMTGQIAGTIVACKAIIDGFSEPLNKIRNGQKFDSGDFNLYRNMCLKQVGNIKKQVEKTGKIIANEKKNFEKLGRLTESSDYDLDLYDDVFEEGTNLKIRSDLKILKGKYSASMKNIKQYRKSKNYDAAIQEAKNLQRVLKEFEDVIKSTESTVGSVVFGIISSFSIAFLNGLAGVLAANAARITITNALGNTTGLISTRKADNILILATGVSATCNKLIEEWSKPITKAIIGDKLTADDFNGYKNLCLTRIREMKKVVSTTESVIVLEKSEFLKYAKLARQKTLLEMADPKECAENVPFHEYYISDYYSEALKDIDPQTKASMISMAAMVTALAGSIVIGRKLSASHKKKLQKMFKLYEQNHPDVIPASSFEYGLYSEDEASDMKVRTKYSTASMSTKYHIYTDEKNKPFMYVIFSFKRVGSVTYNKTNGGFSSGLVSTSRDEDVIHPECDLILVSPLAKKHPTYYRAYMAYKAGIGHDALNRFIDTMKTELKKSKNTFKESAYNMILEDTEFDGFEEYLESTDDSLFFDEFYKEANEIV